MARVVIWPALVAAVTVPLVLASFSEQLQWRQPIYIIAGFAGILGFCLMLAQPLLVAGALPGLERFRGRRVHRWVGGALLGAVALHVGGLWIFSPPDVVDALLLRSPTPFSVWGVLAMWALFGAAALALWRRRLRLRTWRLGHSALVSLAVAGTILHVVWVQGTMEAVSKIILCVLVGVALVFVLVRQRVWAKGSR